MCVIQSYIGFASGVSEVYRCCRSAIQQTCQQTDKPTYLKAYQLTDQPSGELPSQHTDQVTAQITFEKTLGQWCCSREQSTDAFHSLCPVYVLFAAGSDSTMWFVFLGCAEQCLDLRTLMKSSGMNLKMLFLWMIFHLKGFPDLWPKPEGVGFCIYQSSLR